MEEWKTIEEFPKYEVSNFGVVRKKRNKHINKYHVKSGKLAVYLYNENKVRSDRGIAQLVARAFIPEAKGVKRLKVMHKNGNVQDNRVCNLEIKKHDTHRIELPKKQTGSNWILLYKSKNDVMSFRSLDELRRYFGIHFSNIQVARGYLEGEGYAVNLVQDAEKFAQFKSKRDMKKRLEVQQHIRCFLNYVQIKYGMNWADSDELNDDEFVKKHYRYMRSVR